MGWYDLFGAPSLPATPQPFSFFAPSAFVWSQAPLSDVRMPLAAAAAYVLVMLSLSRYMRVVRNGQGVETKFLQAAHNLILAVGSLAMLLGTLREMLLRAAAEPIDGTYGRATYLFCEPQGSVATGSLYYWSYLYYLSKYYELVDTLLQLMKGRPPPHFFLHVYHHAVVLLMAWSWLVCADVAVHWPTLQHGRSRAHVLLLFPPRARPTDAVEAHGHSGPDHTVWHVARLLHGDPHVALCRRRELLRNACARLQSHLQLDAAVSVCWRAHQGSEGAEGAKGLLKRPCIGQHTLLPTRWSSLRIADG